MNAAKLLEELKAKEELERRGYRRVKCERCNGTGLRKSFGPFLCPPCFDCGETGWKWQAPLTR